MANEFGPYETKVEIIDRGLNFIDLKIRNRPGVSAYRVFGHRTLNDAYGDYDAQGGGDSGTGGAGPVLFAQVQEEQHFRSVSLQRSGRGMLGEVTRGGARVLYDPVDFIANAAFATDDEISFVRVQEFRQAVGGFVEVQGATNNADPILGPIAVIPPAVLYGTGESPTLTLAGLAPCNTQSVAGSRPALDMDMQDPNPLHLILPRRSYGLTLRATGAQDLLYSFGLYGPMEVVAAGETVSVLADIKEVILACASNVGVGAAAAPFTLTAAILLTKPF